MVGLAAGLPPGRKRCNRHSHFLGAFM
jgi:hypothetical protein